MATVRNTCATKDVERRIDPEDGEAKSLAELILCYNGTYSEAEVEAYFQDTCTPVVSCRSAANDQSIRGIEQWCTDRHLEEYIDTVRTWCKENGAVSLSEVEENFEEIKSLILASEIKPGERVRVRVLKGAWRGQYVAVVLESMREGVRIRHEEDDYVEVLPWSSLGGKKYAMEPVSDDDEQEGGTLAVLRTGRLRVDPQVGAGLELRWVKMGYRVDRVDAHPFQPDLRVGDAIVAIGGAILAGLEEEVEKQFGTAFADGTIFVAGCLDELMRESVDQVRCDAEQLMVSK